MKPISIAVAAGILLAVVPTYAQDASSSGRPDAGAIVFKKCMVCHQVGPNRIPVWSGMRRL